ncbi:MAG: hypothetical protein COW01_11330 [Bdellovibrionales bacterium CG12_big_fil_rev_8_21_14_0_65_38_15]|nr:MAG: hypothetical protein COW01_11330 [Bdellovibrionales bacterium CG12_big_fil_rev_8_21_14_0_65_38_15]PIR29260.1 MAG: hypothetical protein COV38_10975 [Bdellovibrionales bacterium CG11_big_fil_rev_8_21_14_0_20_38_13]
MNISYLFLLLFSFSLHAQDPYEGLNEGFRQFGEVMLISAGDVDSLTLARTSQVGPCLDGNVPNEPQAIDLGLVPEENPDSKWRFSVMMTMGGPRDGLAKNYAQKDDRYREMGAVVDGLILTNYNSYEDTMSAVKAACDGKSEHDKIAMASNLGSRLSSIYDYDRIDNGPNVNMVVSSQNQWDALRSRANGDMQATSGVCRDASLTVSQFLMACGFKNNQVSIEGYRTVGGGHQVTSVRTSDGEVYTINWSELYSSDETSNANPAPNPNLINSGLYYTVYDPETGEVRETRRTELGEVLKSVAGGTPDDPNYLPGLIKLEAGYGVITANVFKTQTARGDIAQGIATYIEKDNVFGILDISAGVAFAHNERSIATSPTRESELSQNIVYAQIEGRFNIPDITLVDRENQTLALRPSAVVSTEGYYSSSRVDDTTPEANGDMFTQATVGLDALYNNGRVGAFVGGEIDYTIQSGRYNNERGTPGEDGSQGGIHAFANSYNVHGGISYDGERFTTALTGEYTIARSGSRSAIGTTIMDQETNSSYSAVYSVYNRNYGTREDFIILRAERDFEIQRMGTVNIGLESRLPVANDFNQATVGLSLRFVPSRSRR